MASITEITLEQLASVDAKLLFKALEMRLSSAGVLKKRGAKKAAKTSSSDGDDAASETSRSVGEGTKKHNDQTKVVSALLKEALAGEKGAAGLHLKVQSVLRSEMGLAADTEPSLEQVSEALAFLKSHPEWLSPNQKAKAAKAAKAEAKPSGDGPAPSGAAAASSAAVKVVVKKAAEAEAPKKKGRPAKSEEEKAAEAAAKKAEKEAAAAAKKAAKEAEKAAKKAEKDSKKSAPAAKKAAEAPAKTDAAEEDNDGELNEIEVGGVNYFWDAESGAVFDNEDGHVGERIGSWNGTDEDISRD